MQKTILRLVGGCLDGLEISWPNGMKCLPVCLQFSFEVEPTDYELQLQRMRWREVLYSATADYTDKDGPEVQEYLGVGDKHYAYSVGERPTIRTAVEVTPPATPPHG
jgi:hypothetical protein